MRAAFANGMSTANDWPARTGSGEIVNVSEPAVSMIDGPLAAGGVWLVWPLVCAFTVPGATDADGCGDGVTAEAIEIARLLAGGSAFGGDDELIRCVGSGRRRRDANDAVAGLRRRLEVRLAGAVDDREMQVARAGRVVNGERRVRRGGSTVMAPIAGGGVVTIVIGGGGVARAYAASRASWPNALATAMWRLAALPWPKSSVPLGAGRGPWPTTAPPASRSS